MPTILLAFIPQLDLTHKMADEIQRRKDTTCSSETVYFNVTYSIVYGGWGSTGCKKDFEVQFFSEPNTYGVVCSTDGYGRSQCGVELGSFSGSKDCCTND